VEQFGLSTETIARVKEVFALYPEIERVVIYGSRAKGNYKPGSDIDLTLIGEHITEAMMLDLETRLDDLLLPYIFDLNRFSSLQNQALIEHIQRLGKPFYEK